MISDTPGRGGEGGQKRANFCGRPLWMAPYRLTTYRHNCFARVARQKVCSALIGLGPRGPSPEKPRSKIREEPRSPVRRVAIPLSVQPVACQKVGFHCICRLTTYRHRSRAPNLLLGQSVVIQIRNNRGPGRASHMEHVEDAARARPC